MVPARDLGLRPRVGRPRALGPRRLDRHGAHPRHGEPAGHGGVAMSAALDASVARYVAAAPTSAARAEHAAAFPQARTPAASCTSTRSRPSRGRGRVPVLCSTVTATRTCSASSRPGCTGTRTPVILEAIRGALDRGLNYGGHSELEGELAERLCARFNAMELGALHQLGHGGEPDGARARPAPHRAPPGALAFKGGYHGGVLAFGGEEPSPVTVPHEWVLGDYDDVEGTGVDPRARPRRDPRSSRCWARAGACRPPARSSPAAARRGDRTPARC